MTRRLPDPSAPVLVGGRRTAIGTAGHGFAGVDVIALTAPVLAAVATEAAALDLPIDDVIIGNCLGPGGNIARVAALAAGLGDAVPGRHRRPAVRVRPGRGAAGGGQGARR